MRRLALNETINVPDYVRRGTTTYRVISDHLGSPRHVVNVADSGDVPFQASYSSFGEVTGTGLDWMPFGFAGGTYDGETGLLRFGERDLDAATGRWTSKDPIRLSSGANIYAYASNDPLNSIDPSGLFSWDDACVIASTCNEECARLNEWNPLGYTACLAGCVAGGIVWEERQPYGREKEGEENVPDCSQWAGKIYEWCVEDGHTPDECALAAAAAYADCMKNGTGRPRPP